MGWFTNIKNYFGEMTAALEQEIPSARTLVVGNPAHTRLKMKFKDVMIVEDVAEHAAAAVAEFEKFYTQGFVNLHLCHCGEQAREVFAAHDIRLVIMDSELPGTGGSGRRLTADFMAQKPGLVILANSSEKSSNQELMAAGAAASLGKDPRRLAAWLAENG